MKKIYEWIKAKLNIRSVVRRLLEKNYYYQGMVQFNEDGKPVICGVSVRWLDEINVKAITEKEAIHKACDMLNKKYTQYDGMIQLW